ncbi:MAG: lipopolysaccharide heptosyltransferase II [Gallionella sp.]
MQKILIVGPSWVGDCMLMQPMLMRLKERYPDCLIDVLAPTWTTSLLATLPQVHETIVNPFPHGEFNIKGRYQLGIKLRAAQYDLAIVLPNSLKSALVPYFAKIPLRVGFIGEIRYGLLSDARRLDKTRLPLMVERFVYLAESPNHEIPRPLENPKLTVSAAQRAATMGKVGLTQDQPIAIFCPGAEYGPAKRWPVAYFAETAQRLHQQGYAIWLIGSAKDWPVAEKIVALGNSTSRNLCGKTDLIDAIALLSCAQLVISNDSGLMHLSAALDIPMLAIFGASSPQFTPPLSVKASIVKLDLKCSPCFKRECPLGHFNCMNQLTPDLLWDKVLQIIN